MAAATIPVWNAFTGQLQNRPAPPLGVRRGVHLAIDTAVAAGLAAGTAFGASYLSPARFKRDRSGNIRGPPLKPVEDRSLNGTAGALKRKLEFTPTSSKRPREEVLQFPQDALIMPRKTRASVVMGRRMGRRRFAGYGTVKSIVEAAKHQKRFMTVKAAAVCGGDSTVAAGQILNITDVTQGTSNNQREGDSIHAKRLTVKIQFNLPAAAGTDSPNCRLILVQCISDSVTDSAANNDYLDATAGVISDVYRLKSNNEWFTYKTLYDRVVKITRQISGGQGSAFIHASIRIPANHQRIFYGGNATNAKVNGIYAIAISESPTVTSAGTTRLVFTD